MGTMGWNHSATTRDKTLRNCSSAVADIKDGAHRCSLQRLFLCTSQVLRRYKELYASCGANSEWGDLRFAKRHFVTPLESW
jgi:hypothetical protein